MLSEKEKKHNREAYREKKKKMTRKTLVILGVIIILLIFGERLWGLIGVNISYSGGVRSVRILKISERGFIWKTWEIEGILAQGNSSTPYRWEFSIDNWDPNKEQILNDIKNAFSTGKMVQVHYNQRAGSVPWRSGTTYFVKQVRF